MTKHEQNTFVPVKVLRSHSIDLIYFQRKSNDVSESSYVKVKIARSSLVIPRKLFINSSKTIAVPSAMHLLAHDVLFHAHSTNNAHYAHDLNG